MSSFGFKHVDFLSGTLNFNMEMEYWNTSKSFCKWKKRDLVDCLAVRFIILKRITLLHVVRARRWHLNFSLVRALQRSWRVITGSNPASAIIFAPCWISLSAFLHVSFTWSSWVCICKFPCFTQLFIEMQYVLFSPKRIWLLYFVITSWC